MLRRLLRDVACPVRRRAARSRRRRHAQEAGDARRPLRRQQLGRHRRRDPAAPVRAARAHQHHPGHRRADGGDPVGPGAVRLLPRDPRAGRRGARPVRGRHVLVAQRARAVRLAAEPRRRRRHQPAHAEDHLAHEGRREPCRPHGDLARRQARARVGLHGQGRGRDRHEDRGDRRRASRAATSRTRTTSRRTASWSTTPASGPSSRHSTTRPSTPARASASSRSSTRPPGRCSARSTWARSWTSSASPT